MARVAEYHYHIWERRRLYQLWKVHETSGPWPWFRSLLVAILTGYGERPVYIGGWMLLLITVMATIYWRWFPYSVTASGQDECWGGSGGSVFGERISVVRTVRSS
jgi:hypothetical protein